MRCYTPPQSSIYTDTLPADHLKQATSKYQVEQLQCPVPHIVVYCSSPVTVCNAARDSQQVLVTALGGRLTNDIAGTLGINNDWSLDAAVPKHDPSYSSMTRHMLLLSLSRASCNAGMVAATCDSTAT